MTYVFVDALFLTLSPSFIALSKLTAHFFDSIHPSGMLLAVLIARAGLKRFNAHRWERYEGVTLGAALLLLGVWILVAAP